MRRITLEGGRIHTKWDPIEREKVLAYLKSSNFVDGPQELADRTCPFCPEVSERCFYMTDGTHVWSDWMVHWVRDHAFRPDDEFVRHVLTASGLS